MLCCPARSPCNASSRFPGGTFKLSSATAAFRIASFLKALRCKSAGKRRLVPDRHSLSVPASRKLAITVPDTTVTRYYCQAILSGCARWNRAWGAQSCPNVSLVLHFAKKPEKNAWGTTGWPCPLMEFGYALSFARWSRRYTSKSCPTPRQSSSRWLCSQNRGYRQRPGNCR